MSEGIEGLVNLFERSSSAEVVGVVGATSKGAAREGLASLEDVTGEQARAANRAIGRATATSTIDVVQQGSNVVVRITRPGFDGYQLIETVVSPGGQKSVVQLAFNSSGSLVHVDPKTP